jgi:hypothetical protein
MGPNEIFATKLTEHRGSSRHFNDNGQVAWRRARCPLSLFRAGCILLFKTQSSASLHPGLRSITLSACSQVLPPQNALMTEYFALNTYWPNWKPVDNAVKSLCGYPPAQLPLKRTPRYEKTANPPPICLLLCQWLCAAEPR